MKEGIIIINKPSGMTSHDVVNFVRRKFNMRRVGHAGTLDPLATGVLVILLGKSTKLFVQFVNFKKAYQATMMLGTATDTADILGKIIQQKPYGHISEEDLERSFESFRGEIEQVPPMVSAVKVNGQKLYSLARRGIEVERPARRINISRLLLEEFHAPEVRFKLECSKGTYVRQLADDIGKQLGCGACITQIKRTVVGDFTLEDAVQLEELHEGHIRHWGI